MVNGHYQPWLVAVSILVGILASYTALSLAMRVRQAQRRARYVWVAGGAMAMGSGIWAMHFVGMQAFRLPLPIGYDTTTTFVSWLLPVVASGLALWQLRYRTVRPRHLVASALLMGLAINAMHYTGMASMQMHPAITYSPWLFALSVAIAIGASALALQIGMRMQEGARSRRMLQLAASVVMGGAIAGMHYTGMAAAHFAPDSVCGAALVGVDQDYLAALVTITTVALLSITLLATIFDARLEERNQTIAASLVAAAERQKLFLLEQQARLDAENVSQMKDDFLATLSHELRTPLNAMLGWSQLLLQGGRDDAALKRGLSTIERNARAQSELIEDMLDMSRLLAGKVRIDNVPLSPPDFINAALDTTRPAALARQVTLVGDLDAGAGRILGDSGRMQQVMVNLLSNAIKFSEPGGVVTVTLRTLEDASVITVQDTGAGIPAAFLPFVFDRFRQADGSSSRRHGGLGLGLAIARQLIDLQGGALSVASAGEGQGAAFTLRMPLASGCAPAPAAAAPALGLPLTALALQGLTVLVIDDALDSLELVQAVLAPSQARILTATGAQEALHLIALHRPDLIISDIGMPVIDGFDFIRKVRALPDRLIASVPVIALTAFSRKEDEQKVLAAGFDEFLAKPLVPAALLQTVAAVNARRTPLPV
ncbi:signal transduction histidine kinase/CheY-like chemotaxis protein [Massilia aurea]|uniref:histidine kinase n=1 Tax=Massilia aurea TaxID=373040 RepID=A0A7W9WY79_9BURK|nr:MHYT domain-containing protein [Massilia aurea]MBB6133011.1 signal transduction histidine kinase/CheY-like chemotaxis protein [Massilia aurea]